MKFWPKIIPGASAVFGFVLVIAVGVVLEWGLRSQAQWELRSKVDKDLSLLSAKLEHIVQSELQLLTYIGGHVRVYGGIKDNDFYRLASHLVKNDSHVRNISLAKGDVLSLIYPLSGNQKALGIDVSTIPDQKMVLLRAKDQEAAVVDGPMKLIQGGVGLIGRYPIFLDQSKGRYWGFVGIDINFQQLMEDAGISLGDQRYLFALQTMDSQGNTSKVLYGDPSVTSKAPQTAGILLPGKLWTLSAIPRHGWNEPLSSYWDLRLVFVLLASLAAMMSYGAARARILFRDHALFDPLTGLPNRILFEDRFNQTQHIHRRMAAGFCVALVDLDDFRVVNVQSGHKHGDHILKDLSKRLVSMIRDTDTVARVGGDKFGFIISNMDRKESAENIASKILDTLSTTYHLPDDIHVVSGSMGLVMVNASSERFEDIMRRVEDALAIAKEQGKARVCIK